MADDDQKPGPSGKSESDNKSAAAAPAGGQKQQQEPAKPQGQKRKRKLSGKNKAAANQQPEEEDVETEKINFMREPVVQCLRNVDDTSDEGVMRSLISHLQPSHHEIEFALTRVKADLSRVLGFPGNDFTIYEFGSIKSGLAFRDSDLDLYIHYDKNSDANTKKLIHVIHGRMLRNQPFHGLVKILGAKVPLLRAIHGPTNLMCDINFSNARGCYNSKFIYAVTRFDHRIHKLAVIVKFWAKCAYLLTNHRQMNTYCIIMMLIFYLQTKKLPLLPSVQDLQKGTPRVSYGPWNLGYPKDIKFATMNRENIRELLTGFFRYYSNFEFEKNLISPFVGRLCSLEEMKQSKVRELQTYYKAVEHLDNNPFNFGTLISIQDPFELNNNIGGVCNSVVHFEQFKLSFKTALAVCSKPNNVPFNKLLEALFTETKRYVRSSKAPPQPKVQVVNGVPQKTAEVGSHWRICKLLALEYELYLVRQIMLAKISSTDSVITEMQIKNMWADCMLDFIEDILKKLFMCEMTLLEDPERSFSLPSTIAQKDVRAFTISCERQVVIKRPRIQFTNDEELNQQIAISKARHEMNFPLKFESRIDMFKLNDAVEVHIPVEQCRNGPLRVFIETCFLPQIRRCVAGYFKIMLAKATEKAAANP
ncbi:poly(A) RNA polymerase GLD2 [Uranotaenia lowii]|uniref:poly(A) RNA polymerase GLD2 n=1 Tax=Uranotaenia lowii TaxID=190385 RepID=UPI002479DFF7|nr:poly(A) RNA polymerase GLD2 [Uranotaenia lowii]